MKRYQFYIIVALLFLINSHLTRGWVADMDAIISVVNAIGSLVCFFYDLEL